MRLKVKKVNGWNRYYILDTARASGREENLIACYDTLEEAAVVMRYIGTANMPLRQQDKALRYISEWDEREARAAIEDTKKPN